MFKIGTAALLALACSTLATSAAAASRTFVSVTGSDVGPCSATAPCRTIGAAILVTDPGGEVVAVDSGGYGPFAVDKPIQIVAAPGAHVAVTATIGTAVTVRLPSGDFGPVVLRGLAIHSLGADTGIDATAMILHLEDLVVDGFSAYGIRASGFKVTVTNTTVKNGGASGDGLWLSIPFGQVERVRVENNRTGLSVIGRVAIRHSLVAGNAAAGIEARTLDGAVAGTELTIESSLVGGNGVGLLARGAGTTTPGARLRVSRTTVVGNGVGLQTETGASILSRVDNTLEGNGVAGAFSGTLAGR